MCHILCPVINSLTRKGPKTLTFTHKQKNKSITNSGRCLYINSSLDMSTFPAFLPTFLEK